MKASNILSLFENSSRFRTKVDFETDEVLEVLEQVTVDWSANIEYRNWGIKAIDIEIPNQSVTISAIVDTEKSDVRFDIHDVEVQYDTLTIPLAPTKLTYFKGKWVLEF